MMTEIDRVFGSKGEGPTTTLPDHAQEEPHRLPRCAETHEGQKQGLETLGNFWVELVASTWWNEMLKIVEKLKKGVTLIYPVLKGQLAHVGSIITCCRMLNQAIHPQYPTVRCSWNCFGTFWMVGLPGPQSQAQTPGERDVSPSERERSMKKEDSVFYHWPNRKQHINNKWWET